MPPALAGAVGDEVVHEQVLAPRQRVRAADARERHETAVREGAHELVVLALLAADLAQEGVRLDPIAQGRHERKGGLDVLVGLKGTVGEGHRSRYSRMPRPAEMASSSTSG
jgi:hypothetical protein